MRQCVFGVLAVCVSAFALAAGFGFASQPEGKIQTTTFGPRMIKDFYDVRCATDPADDRNLVVRVEAIDPQGEGRSAKIIPGCYETPPEDGIQDLFVVAEPAGIGRLSRTKYKVEYNWKNFRKDAPWIKGIRVYSGVGVVVWPIEHAN